MWPLRLDVSRVSYAEVVRILVPFFPGAILLCGLILANFQPIRQVFVTNLVGYRSKLFLVIFLTYLAGFVLMNLSELLHTALAWAIGFRARSLLKWASFEQLSRDILWRRAAKKFLGDDLAPQTLEPYTDAARQQAFDQTKTIQDSQERIKRSIELVGESVRRAQVDSEWTEIYAVLRPLFVRPSSQDLIAIYGASAFGSMGWAGVIALVYAGSTLWLFWLVAILCILVGIFSAYTVQVLSGAFLLDFNSALYTANLLRETRCTAPDFLDTELSLFMLRLLVQGAAGEPGLA
jgi:hypothetical protein